MKTCTICGSMRFEKEMMEIAYDLEAHKGYNILQCVYCNKTTAPTEQELAQLAEAHYKKIDLSDGIHVVNMDGCIGEAVKNEIAYALKHNKEDPVSLHLRILPYCMLSHCF